MSRSNNNNKNRTRKAGRGTLAGAENDSTTDALIRYARRQPLMGGICVSPTPLAPAVMRVVLSYTEQVTLTSTIGAYAAYLFKGNGLFDPNQTGTGHQPVGFDQWAPGIYRRYRVMASTISVSLLGNITTNPQGLVRLAVSPNLLSAGYTDFDAQAAQPYCWHRLINTPFGVGTPSNRIVKSMETSLLNGVPGRAVLEEENYSALYSADPADTWYWVIGSQSADQATTTALLLDVQVQYVVDFYDRNIITVSIDERIEALKKLKKRLKVVSTSLL